MKIADIRREFLLLEHMHDLDKRLLRVFELGAREGALGGAEAQYGLAFVPGPIRQIGEDEIMAVVRDVMEAVIHG